MSESIKFLILGSSFLVLVVSFASGVWARKKITSPEDFFGGARIFGPLTVGLATMAAVGSVLARVIEGETDQERGDFRLIAFFGGRELDSEALHCPEDGRPRSSVASNSTSRRPSRRPGVRSPYGRLSVESP